MLATGFARSSPSFRAAHAGLGDQRAFQTAAARPAKTRQVCRVGTPRIGADACSNRIESESPVARMPASANVPGIAAPTHRMVPNHASNHPPNPPVMTAASRVSQTQSAAFLRLPLRQHAPRKSCRIRHVRYWCGEAGDPRPLSVDHEPFLRPRCLIQNVADKDLTACRANRPGPACAGGRPVLHRRGADRRAVRCRAHGQPVVGHHAHGHPAGPH